MTKTIVLADDHAFLLAGLRAALEAGGGIKVVAEARDGIQAIAMIRRHRPDCAVLDQSMPGATGLEVVFESRRWSPETRFVIVTGTAQPAILDEVRRAGVQGILLKSMPPDAICDGVRQVAQGGEVIPPGVARLIGAAAQAQHLTARELEVLHAIARGLSNAGTSEALGISAKTVDSHRTSLMRKLGVNSTAALLMRAMRDGLIDASGPN